MLEEHYINNKDWQEAYDQAWRKLGINHGEQDTEDDGTTTIWVSTVHCIPDL